MTIPILVPNSTSLLFVTPSESTVGYVVQVTLETTAHTASQLSEQQKLKKFSGAVMQLVIAHLSAPASVPLVCFIEWHELKVQARRKRWALAQEYMFNWTKDGRDKSNISAAPDKWIFSVY